MATHAKKLNNGLAILCATHFQETRFLEKGNINVQTIGVNMK